MKQQNSKRWIIFILMFVNLDIGKCCVEEMKKSHETHIYLHGIASIVFVLVLYLILSELSKK